MEAEPVYHSHPQIMGGTPVFAGTRVPVRTLFEYLKAGDSLGEFLEDYPGVTRQQAVSVLQRAVDAVLRDVPRANTDE